MSIQMVDPQGQLLREVADRDDVALTYAFALRQAGEIDWPLVNRAILDRWSLSALKHIKERAWKLVEA